MSTPPRILLVEDDARIVSFLVKGLEAEGYALSVAEDGAAAVTRLLEEGDELDLVLLDLGLPRASGFDVLRLLRHEHPRLAVIILTARDDIADKVAGLDLGANDYVTKPFVFAELLARIRAARRVAGGAGVELCVGDLRLDLLGRVAWRAGRRIELSPREWALLELFARNAGRVLPRAEILAAVWSIDFAQNSNVVDVYVRYLRRKCDVPGLPPVIRTLRGVGYRLEGGEQRA
jgi:DNA-binding response OmpR family regulator